MVSYAKGHAGAFVVISGKAPVFKSSTIILNGQLEKPEIGALDGLILRIHRNADEKSLREASEAKQKVGGSEPSLVVTP